MDYFKHDTIGMHTHTLLVLPTRNLHSRSCHALRKALTSPSPNVGAGSNLIIQNGGASALAFFVNAYASVSPTVKGTDLRAPALPT